MTRRDLRWRAGGVSLAAAGCAAATISRGSPAIVLALALVFVGLMLIVSGKRVAVAVRAERRGHAHTARVIRARRGRRGRD